MSSVPGENGTIAGHVRWVPSSGCGVNTGSIGLGRDTTLKYIIMDNTVVCELARHKPSPDPEPVERYTTSSPDAGFSNVVIKQPLYVPGGTKLCLNDACISSFSELREPPRGQPMIIQTQYVERMPTAGWAGLELLSVLFVGALLRIRRLGHKIRALEFVVAFTEKKG